MPLSRVPVSSTLGFASNTRSCTAVLLEDALLRNSKGGLVTVATLYFLMPLRAVWLRPPELTLTQACSRARRSWAAVVVLEYAAYQSTVHLFGV